MAIQVITQTDTTYLLDETPLADAPEVLLGPLFFPVTIFELLKLLLDLLMGSFSFPWDSLPSVSVLLRVFPYMQT